MGGTEKKILIGAAIGVIILALIDRPGKWDITEEQKEVVVSKGLETEEGRGELAKALIKAENGKRNQKLQEETPEVEPLAVRKGYGNHKETPEVEPLAVRKGYGNHKETILQGSSQSDCRYCRCFVCDGQTEQKKIDKRGEGTHRSQTLEHT